MKEYAHKNMPAWYVVSNNGTISIKDGKIYVNGQERSSCGKSADDISLAVYVEGNVNSLRTDNAPIGVKGSVGDINTVNGNVKCANVSGYVNSVNGNIRCESVNGDANSINGDVRINHRD